MTCKILLTYLLSWAPLAISPGEGGWVTLAEPIRLVPEQPFKGSEDSSIWPVFMKKWGKEIILIRFPEDPEYEINAKGELEIWAGAHRLIVSAPTLEVERVASSSQDFDSGSWKWISTYYTAEATYRLETTRSVSEEAAHLRFVNSFLVPQ